MEGDGAGVVVLCPVVAPMPTGVEELVLGDVDAVDPIDDGSDPDDGCVNLSGGRLLMNNRTSFK
eukprot:14159142-Ditylum_brightwellii.AAC.1